MYALVHEYGMNRSNKKKNHFISLLLRAWYRKTLRLSTIMQWTKQKWSYGRPIVTNGLIEMPYVDNGSNQYAQREIDVNKILIVEQTHRLSKLSMKYIKRLQHVWLAFEWSLYSRKIQWLHKIEIKTKILPTTNFHPFHGSAIVTIFRKIRRKIL